MNTSLIITCKHNFYFIFLGGVCWGFNINFLELGANTYTSNNGLQVPVAILPIYNQSGTASSTDLLINRTETALGSGTHKLADFQVGGVTRFNVTNAGNVGIGTASRSRPARGR